jgi:hypothetical protein
MVQQSMTELSSDATEQEMIIVKISGVETWRIMPAMFIDLRKS